ncbi:hypothetical protein ACWDOP_33775 [Nocardia sp. NPDC003693]
MSCEFIVLPADSVAAPHEVTGYLESRLGTPAAVSLGLILADLWRWNTEIPVWNGRIILEPAGDCIRISVPEHAAWRALLWIEELIADTGFALYDPTDGTLEQAEPRKLRVNLGGARYFRTLTPRQLRSWIPQLHLLTTKPFLIVDEPGNEGTFIQTYREAPDEYILEYRDGDMVTTSVQDPLLVARLMWDWVNDRHDALNELHWEPVS